MMQSMPTDFWGIAVPTWVAAVGGVISAVVAAIAFFSSIRNRKGLNTLRGGANRAALEEGLSEHPLTPIAVPSSVRWEVIRETRRKWRLANISSRPALLIAFNDVTPDGDDAAALLIDPPVEVGPGVSIPFIIDKSLVSPAVTAIRIEWLDGDSVEELVLYV